MDSLQYLALINLPRDENFNSLPFKFIAQFFSREPQTFLLQTNDNPYSLRLRERFDSTYYYYDALNNYNAFLLNDSGKIERISNTDWLFIHLTSVDFEDDDITPLQDCKYRKFGFYNPETSKYDLCYQCATSNRLQADGDISNTTVEDFHSFLTKPTHWCLKCWTAPLFKYSICDSFDCAIEEFGYACVAHHLYSWKY